MLDAFEKSCAALGHTEAHIERFTAVEVAASVDAKSSYTVELRRSGKVIEVTPDKSLLDTMLDAGVDVPVAGHQGHCQILSNVGRKAAGGAGDADAGFSVFESGTEIEAKGVRIVNGNL